MAIFGGGGGIRCAAGADSNVLVVVAGGFSVQENLLYIESKTVHTHKL